MLILLLVLIYLSFISVGAPTYLLGASWPLMYEAIGVPVSYVGAISIIIMGFTVIASFLCERIIKRFEAGILAASSILILAVSLFGFTMSNNFVLLCLFAAPMGFGIGLADAVLNNFVAIHYRAMHMNWLHCFWGIGATLGPIILSYAMLSSGRWQTGYRIIGIFQFVLAALLILSVPMWRKAAKEKSLEKEQEKTPVKFKELLRLKGVKPVLAVFFCYCSIEATIGLWGSGYLVFEKNVAPEAAAKWISLFFLGITLGRFLSGFISIKLSVKQIQRLSFIIFACGLLVTAMSSAEAAYITGFLLMGLGCAPIFPCLLHETPGKFGEKYSQAVIGAEIAFAYFGSAVIPPIFGIIAPYTGYGSFSVFLGLFFIMMVVLVETFDAKVKNNSNAL